MPFMPRSIERPNHAFEPPVLASTAARGQRACKFALSARLRPHRAAAQRERYTALMALTGFFHLANT